MTRINVLLWKHLQDIYSATIQFPKTTRDPALKKDNRRGKLTIERVRSDPDGQQAKYQFDYIYLTIVNFDENINAYKKLASALNHYKPYVEVKYFSLGEKYGVSEKTIVRNYNTIVKDIKFEQNGKKYDLLEYVNLFALKPLIGEVANID